MAYSLYVHVFYTYGFKLKIIVKGTMDPRVEFWSHQSSFKWEEVSE